MVKFVLPRSEMVPLWEGTEFLSAAPLPPTRSSIGLTAAAPPPQNVEVKLHLWTLDLHSRPTYASVTMTAALHTPGNSPHSMWCSKHRLQLMSCALCTENLKFDATSPSCFILHSLNPDPPNFLLRILGRVVQQAASSTKDSY